MIGIGKNWDSEILLPLVLEEALPRNFSRLRPSFPDRIDPQRYCFRILVVIVPKYRKGEFKRSASYQISRLRTTDS